MVNLSQRGRRCTLRPRTLSAKLVLSIVPVTCALLVATVWVGYDTARRRLEEQMRAEAMKQVRAAAATIDSYADRVGVVVRAIAARQESLGPAPDASTIPFLSHLLDSIGPEEAHGVFVAFAQPGGLRALQWVDRKSQPRAVTRGRDPAQEWFTEPLARGNLHVSEPFPSERSDTLLVSVSRPFFDDAARPLGIAGADLSLDLIQAIVAQIRFRPGEKAGGEYAFLLGRDGRVISHPKIRPGMSRDPAGLADVAATVKAAEGSALVEQINGRRHVVWSTGPLTGWRIGLNIPESIILAPARDLAVRTAGVATLSILVMIGLTLTFARRTIEPVHRLTSIASEVAVENYEHVDQLRESARRHDELGKLARGFRTMVRAVVTREVRLKQAEENLAQREMYFRSLIESTSDVVAIFDGGGRVRYASPSLGRMLGIDPQSANGQPGFAAIGAENLAEANRVFAGVCGEPGAVGRLEIRARRADGDARILETTLHNLLDNLSVHGVVVNLRDVTERKQVEAMAQEKEAAQAANQAKSAFLASMSHELRTPLNAIIGYSEMLAEEAPEDLAPDLEKIQAAGRHLLELINSILDISKIEAGKMELYLETFPVAKMASDITAIIEPLAKKSGNRLCLELEDDLGTMRADLTKVRQTLFNLLSNACKFTRDGQITLAVARRGSGLEFRVSDSGIGMTPEQMGRLFQAFTQADASTSARFGGTGLGLAISQRFCQMMGGSIRVESEAGAGTTFFVSLPIAVPSRPANASPPLPDTDSGRPILVIDDDPNVHDLIRRSLAKSGFPVMTAVSGAEGIQAARRERPQVITLDAMMPEMDGWAVLRELKAHPETAHIPVIMLTIVDDRNLGFSLGASGYLTKPIDRDRLDEMIRRLCGKDANHAPATVSGRQ
jgi:PAS domain S-box-containing protein